MLTQERLQEVLEYSPESGLFVWRVNASSRAYIGDIAGCVAREGYIQVCIDKRIYRAHRLAFLYMTGAWPVNGVDHINGVRDDNRWENLRDVPHSVNMQNRTFKGYSEARGKFRSYITAEGKCHFLGNFESAEEAGAAYSEAKKRLHNR